MIQNYIYNFPAHSLPEKNDNAVGSPFLHPVQSPLAIFVSFICMNVLDYLFLISFLVFIDCFPLSSLHFFVETDWRDVFSFFYLFFHRHKELATIVCFFRVLLSILPFCSDDARRRAYIYPQNLGMLG